MAKQDLRLSFKTNKPVGVAFAAITNVAAWWGMGVKGESSKKGDKFVYKHKDFHTSTQTVIEFVKDQRLVWKVSESKISFVKDSLEWEGTEVEFLVEKDGDGSKLTLIHHGLSPRLECFQDCSRGWEYYFSASLKKLIETGKGEPDPSSFGI